MKGKIFRVTSALTLAVAIAMALLATGVYYAFYRTEAQSGLKALAHAMASFGQGGEALEPEYLNGIMVGSYPYALRLTVIDTEGEVVYDTKPREEWSNHKDRKEVAEAFDRGTGSDTRISESMGKNAYYYAVRVESDGNTYVLRLSRDIESIWAVFITIVPFLCLAAFAVIVIATFFAYSLSKSLIAPVAGMVEGLKLKQGGEEVQGSSETLKIEGIEYEELRPLAVTVRELARENAGYIKRLSEEKAAVSVIMDNMVEGVILLDAKEDIVSINDSAVKILNPGFVKGGDAPRNILQLTHSPQLIKAIEGAKEAFSLGRGVLEPTVIEGEQENEGRRYHLFISQVSPATGIENGLLLLLVDNTQMIRAEEARRDFAANVSHELKTPLTTIKGFGELLGQGAMTDTEAITRCGQRIHRESERLLLLINDILRLSEIEDGVHSGGGLELETVDLGQAVRNMAVLLESMAVEKGVKLEVLADVGAPSLLKCEPAHIEELVRNLAENAIRYNEPGGWVRLGLRNLGNMLELTVEDNGIGIPQQHQEQIFQRFYRVDRSRSKATGGTGLGLSIVKHVVALYKGQLKLESALGKGTKITVLFNL